MIKRGLSWACCPTVTLNRSIRTQVLFLFMGETCFPPSLIYLVSQNATSHAPEINQVLEMLDGTDRPPDPFTSITDLQEH